MSPARDTDMLRRTIAVLFFLWFFTNYRYYDENWNVTFESMIEGLIEMPASSSSSSNR